MPLTPNVGELGIKSIRIGGRRVGELSKVEQMMARKQIALTEEEMKIKEIKDKYPKYKVPNLKAGIVEARANIVRFQETVQKEQETIAEFSALLALCEQRDRELKNAGVAVE